jgi:hypothetical protein
VAAIVIADASPLIALSRVNDFRIAPAVIQAVLERCDQLDQLQHVLRSVQEIGGTSN